VLEKHLWEKYVSGKVSSVFQTRSTGTALLGCKIKEFLPEKNAPHHVF
jgi:hypothetical protein